MKLFLPTVSSGFGLTSVHVVPQRTQAFDQRAVELLCTLFVTDGHAKILHRFQGT